MLKEHLGTEYEIKIFLNPLHLLLISLRKRWNLVMTLLSENILLQLEGRERAWRN